MRAASISFEKRYANDSGVEFRVALVGDQVVFEDTRCKVVMPAEILPWIMCAISGVALEASKKEG